MHNMVPILSAISLNTIRDDIEEEEIYDKLVESKPDAAQTVVSKSKEEAGPMNFNTNFESVSNFFNSVISRDSEAIEKTHKGFKLAADSPILYTASVLLFTGSDTTKAIMLRIYGESTTLNEEKFRKNYSYFQSLSLTCSNASTKPNISKKCRKRRVPPSPCPLCEGRHWKSRCPIFSTQNE